MSNATMMTIDVCDLENVTGGFLQGAYDGTKRVLDTTAKGAGYGAALGGIGGFVVGGPAGAGTGAGVGAAGGAAIGLGWGLGREVGQAINKTGPYAPKKK